MNFGNINKYHISFFLLFIIIGLITDYNVFKLRGDDNSTIIDPTIEEKSLVIVEIHSKDVKNKSLSPSSALLSNINEYATAMLVNLIEKRIEDSKINNLYMADYMNVYHSSKFGPHFTLEIVEKYFNKGIIVVEFRVFSRLVNEQLTIQVEEFANLLIKSSSKLIFGLLNQYVSEQFYEIPGADSSKKNNYNEIPGADSSKKNNYNEILFANIDKIDVFTVFNRKPGPIIKQAERYLFANFVPVFTLLVVLSAFIFFIIITVTPKKNK